MKVDFKKLAVMEPEMISKPNSFLSPPRLPATFVEAGRHPLTIIRLKLAFAATTVARRERQCGVRKGNLVIITTRPITPRAHDYNVGTEAKSPLDHVAAIR
eukprot:4424456-Pleurochrysis_carterae.AAC.1